MESTAAKQNCSLEACAKSAVVLAEQRGFCLDHYFEWCYQRLEELERQVRQKSVEGVKEKEDAGLRVLIEECSNRALAVSLRHEPLTNQDRSRLLDILLWTGDLLYLLRAPRAQVPESVAYRSKRTRVVPALRTRP